MFYLFLLIADFSNKKNQSFNYI